jgi:hypothetical protein
MQEFMEDYVDAYRMPGIKRVTLEDIIKHAGHRLLTDIPKVYSMIPKESSELHKHIKRLVDDMNEFAVNPPNLYKILQLRSRLDNIAEECDIELENELFKEHNENLIVA